MTSGAERAMRYIALLRGINVGGNTMIKMEELRAMFEALNFGNIVSYINSGNLAFDVADALQKLAQNKGGGVRSPHGSTGSAYESSLVTTIESAIEKTFAKSISVMVREQSYISDVLESNPFAGEFESHKEMHVLFLQAEMPGDKVQQLLERQTPDERFAVIGREIYCHLKTGVADSLLGKGFIDKRLKVAVTGRNWRTVEKLASL